MGDNEKQTEVIRLSSLRSETAVMQDHIDHEFHFCPLSATAVSQRLSSVKGLAKWVPVLLFVC